MSEGKTMVMVARGAHTDPRRARVLSASKRTHDAAWQIERIAPRTWDAAEAYRVAKDASRVASFACEAIGRGTDADRLVEEVESLADAAERLLADVRGTTV